MSKSVVYKEIVQEAQALQPALVKIRRDFHKYAESGWKEIRTSSLIAKRLTDLGFDEVLTGPEVCKAKARMGLPSKEVLAKEYARALAQGAVQPFAERAKNGFTGVIGILHCGQGPVIALRFDIDALGVFEDKSKEHLPTREGFSSVNAGMMHACGHDGHATTGLGVAELLIKHRNLLHGTVKLIFQPGEEGVRGARAIVEQGHLDDVNYVIGNHVTENTGRKGQISYNIIPSLATSKLDVHFVGLASHAGAEPEKGHSAMLAAATAVLNLNAIPRHGRAATRINIGRLVAGSGRNVTCDRADMELEVRGSTTEANKYMEDYARRIIKNSAAMHQCTAKITLAGAAESVINSPELMELCTQVCEKKLGIEVGEPITSGAGSEDFSYMINRVKAHGGQGLFFRTLTPFAALNHCTNFDFGEAALPTAVAVFCGMVLTLMGVK